MMAVESLIGLSQSEVEHQFGDPDELGRNDSKEAVVWTYIIRQAGEINAASSIAGYRQIAFWNGSERRSREALHATSLTARNTTLISGITGRRVAFGSVY